MKNAWVLSYPLRAQRRLLSDWADAQADLSLRWAHSHFVSFVMSWHLLFCFPLFKLFWFFFLLFFFFFVVVVVIFFFFFFFFLSLLLFSLFVFLLFFFLFFFFVFQCSALGIIFFQNSHVIFLSISVCSN